MGRDLTDTIRTTIPQGRVKFFGGVGAREFGGVISDPSTDRMSDVIVPSGCDYAAFLRAGTILGQHDALLPIAKPLSIDVRSDSIYMRGTFPEAGVSDVADQYCRLVKAGILNSFSIGFLPRRWEPIKNGGLRFTDWELLEVSIVSVPALSSALITERSLGRRDPATEERLQRALRLKRRLDGIATRDDRAAGREFDFQIAVKLAEAQRLHEAAMQRKDRAAAMDAVARAASMWW